MNIEELKRNLSITDTLAEYGIRVNAKGFCKCIYHDDHRASMKIYPDQNSFYCFSCGARGDVIDWVRQYNNCDLKTAYKLLGGKDDKELTWAEKKKLELAKERRERYRIVLNDVNQRIAETEFRVAEYERGIRFEGILTGTITDNMVEYGKQLIQAERDLAMYNDFKNEWIRQYERNI